MYELNKHPLSLGYCKMAELEGLEEKLSAIWYIETPTHFTSGLGNLTTSTPPLGDPTLPLLHHQHNLKGKEIV